MGYQNPGSSIQVCLPDSDMYFHLHICIYVNICENIYACIFLHRYYADEIITLKTLRLVAVGTSYMIPQIWVFSSQICAKP